MKKYWFCSFSLFIVATLFGCGGGGGGGGAVASAGLTTTLFTDWSSVDPPERIQASGISHDTEYDADPDALLPFDIKGVSTTSTARISYRADGTIERIDVVTPYLSLSWNEANGDSIVDAAGEPWVIAGDAAQTELGVLFNPLEMAPAEAWEYQTFGVWATGRGVSGAIGAITVGTPTAGVNIPLPDTDQGDVTFTGYSAGIYTSSDGTAAYRTKSDVSVAVNFFERELVFNTTGTTLTDIETNQEWTDSPPTLDVTGVLTYASGVNAFTGKVTANGTTGGMTGQSTGQFYGPVAEELGGVFSLSGDQYEYYSGAYGAARP